MRLSVMTFNIRFDCPDDGENQWLRRRDMLTEMLREEDPDVFGLQEVLARQWEFLVATLPTYHGVTFGRDDGMSRGEMASICFRADRFGVKDLGHFWLSETPDQAGSVGWGAHHPRICTWARLSDSLAGRNFYVYNVHLDNASQLAREKGGALLRDRIRARGFSDPVLVMGDFNAEEDSKAVQDMLAVDSPIPVDAVRAAQPEVDLGGTWHGFAGQPRGGRIDYIFCSPEWAVDSSRVIRTNRNGRYPSDHFPVAVDLEWPA